MIKKSATEIRKQARERLKGHWCASVVVVLIYVAITIGIAVGVKKINPLISPILTLTVVYPLLFGMYRFFDEQRIGKTYVGSLFSSFRNKNWIQAIIVQVVFIIGMIISLIPFLAIVFARITSMLIQENMNSIGFMPQQSHDLSSVMIGNIIWFIISLVFLIPVIVYGYTYSQVVMVSVYNDKSLNIKNIFKRSRKLMKNNKWRLFKFQISYIGWYILGLIALLVGTLWFLAYFIQGNVEFFNEICEEYARDNQECTKELFDI